MEPTLDSGHTDHTSWTTAIAADLRALFRCRYLIRNLASTQLKLRYHRSLLGIIWTLLNPLLLLGVQAVAFGQILNVGIKAYALYLLSGIVVWHFFSNAIESASRTLIANEGLIRVIPTPKFVFPVADTLVSLAHSGFALAAFFVLIPIFGGALHPQLVLLPAAIVLLAVFTFGVSLVTMTLMTMFRDFAHIIGVVLTAVYFASPILYPPYLIDRFQFMLKWNPLSYYLELFHAALSPITVLSASPDALAAAWPSPFTWTVAVACSLGALLIGYLTYKKFEHEYIYHL